MKFISRRNLVTFENGEVVKRYADEAALVRETLALEYLYHGGLPVPEILAKDDSTIRMRYISGKIYADLTENMTLEKAEALAGWLSAYRHISGFLKGDVNLRNFLWTGTECVGLDFEEPPLQGDWESDLGKIMAFAVTYQPSFTPGKAKCAKFLLQAFLRAGGEEEKIREAYVGEIAAMNARRTGECVDMEMAVLFFDKTARKIRGGVFE